MEKTPRQLIHSVVNTLHREYEDGDFKFCLFEVTEEGLAKNEDREQDFKIYTTCTTMVLSNGLPNIDDLVLSKKNTQYTLFEFEVGKEYEVAWNEKKHSMFWCDNGIWYYEGCCPALEDHIVQ